MIKPLWSSGNLHAAPRMRGATAEESVRTDRLGRLIQMTLAVYLIPVLLVVVVISGVGMMLVGVGETTHGLNERVKRSTSGNR
jgi:hypothetical protein